MAYLSALAQMLNTAQNPYAGYSGFSPASGLMNPLLAQIIGALRGTQPVAQRPETSGASPPNGSPAPGAQAPPGVNTQYGALLNNPQLQAILSYRQQNGGDPRFGYAGSVYNGSSGYAGSFGAAPGAGYGYGTTNPGGGNYTVSQA